MSSPGEAGANANPAVFSRPAVVLHWLIALFIACGFTLGAYMVDLHASPTKVRLFAYHKWIGITVLGLVLIRLVWRLTMRCRRMNRCRAGSASPPMPRIGCCTC